jgi:hypothetical protein
VLAACCQCLILPILSQVQFIFVKESLWHAGTLLSRGASRQGEPGKESMHVIKKGNVAL